MSSQRPRPASGPDLHEWLAAELADVEAPPTDADPVADLVAATKAESAAALEAARAARGLDGGRPKLSAAQRQKLRRAKLSRIDVEVSIGDRARFDAVVAEQGSQPEAIRYLLTLAEALAELPEQ